MDVTKAELAVLEALWENSPATRKALVGKLYPSETESDRATVQKLLERLERKSYVERDSSRRPHEFRAAISREDYLAGRLQSLADSICGGSFGALVTHLVKGDKLSAHDLDELRALIDSHEDEGGKS